MTTLTLPTLLPLPEAARKYGLDEARLRTLVEKGKIRAGIIPETGEVLVSEEEVRGEAIEAKGLRKEDLPEYQRFGHLKNQTIGLAEASAKYVIPIMTLSGWVKKGIVRKVGVKGQKYLLNEQDIAYCASIYRQHGKKGRILFNRDGTPYISRHRATVG